MHGVDEVIPHEECLKTCREDEAKAVYDVQPLEADDVFHPRLSHLFFSIFEKDLDADGSGHQEGCCYNLRDQTYLGQVLIPVNNGCVSKECFIL